MINIRDLLGIPFTNRGRTLDGLDCYGLVMEVYKKFDITLPEYNADFDDTENITKIIRKQMREDKLWKRLDKPKTPCVVAIRYGVPRPMVNHCGVYIGDGLFMHTRSKTGAVIEHIDSPMWRNLIVGFYEYRGNK